MYWLAHQSDFQLWWLARQFFEQLKRPDSCFAHSMNRDKSLTSLLPVKCSLEKCLMNWSA